MALTGVFLIGRPQIVSAVNIPVLLYADNVDAGDRT
jgi:hypothetical protein